MLHEGREGVGPLRLAAPRPGVLPLLCDGAVQALDLSVLPGAERPRIYVPAAGRLQQLVELAAAVARAVVRHHAFDRESQPREEAQRGP